MYFFDRQGFALLAWSHCDTQMNFISCCIGVSITVPYMESDSNDPFPFSII